MPKEKSAGAVIFVKEPSFVKTTEDKNSKIYYLLLHYKSGHWDFPKGHIEKEETEEETTKREVEEETGLKDIEIIKGFKESIKYFFRLKGRNIFKTVVFYLAEARTKEVKISWEHIGYKWLPYYEALKQLTFKNAKEILKKANDYILEHET